MSRGAIARRTPLREAFCALLLVTMLAGSTIETFKVPLGPFSLYVGQCLAPIALVVATPIRPIEKVVARWLVGFGAACLLAGIPAVLSLPESAQRFAQILQLEVNIGVMFCAYVLANRLGPKLLGAWLVRFAVVLVLSAVFQSLFAPGSIAESGERLYGLPRPDLFFSEPTWLATFAALVSTILLVLRRHAAGYVLAALVLTILTRGALLIVVGAVIGQIRLRPRIVQAGMWAAGIGLTGWFLSRAFFGPAPKAQATSIDSRLFDSFVIRTGNDSSFFPWGGRVLHYEIPNFWKPTPDVSNIWTLDEVWKFGIGGICVCIGFWLLVTSVLPRIARLDRRDRRLQAGICALIMIPPSLEFNNAFGRAWLWCALGVLLAAMAAMTDGDDPQGEVHRGSTRVRRPSRPVRDPIYRSGASYRQRSPYATRGR